MTTAPGSAVFTVRGGVRLSVPNDLRLITPYVVAEQEDWFEQEIRFVRAWLQPGMAAVDVGASFGLYTLAIARAVGPAGRVLAFEPATQPADHLERSLRLNGFDHAALRRQAISDAAGTVGFRARQDTELGGIAEGPSGGDTVQLEVTSLDQALAGWQGLDFLKLDVEGHEVKAIQGAARLLERTSPLVMFEVRRGDTIELNMLEPLALLGYGFYRLLPGPLVLAPFNPDEPGEPSQLNLFACKPDRAAELAAAGWVAPHTEVEVTGPRFEAWLRWSAAEPYAAGLAGAWPAKASGMPGRGGAGYADGLAAFGHAREAHRPVSERVAWLQHALLCVSEARDIHDTVPRCLSLARIAWELGFVTEALGALRKAKEGLREASASRVEEPFIAPSPRLDMLAGAGDPDWLVCAAVEQYERLVKYSSIFDPEDTLAQLALVLNTSYRSKEMLRRHQLASWLTGRRPALESLPELCDASEENLNPGFWAALPSAAGRR